jgi:histidine ammonia-lyase
MGANAALITQKVINNSYEVIAIEFLALIQALDYLDILPKISRKARSYYEDLRALVPKFKEDTIKYKDQEKIILYLKSKIEAI